MVEKETKPFGGSLQASVQVATDPAVIVVRPYRFTVDREVAERTVERVLKFLSEISSEEKAR